MTGRCHECDGLGSVAMLSTWTDRLRYERCDRCGGTGCEPSTKEAATMGRITIADWCDGLREWVPTINDPTLAYGMAETIGPGDTYDDGALRTDDDHRIPNGRVWLHEDKLANAAYYGWRELGFVTVDRSGRTMHLISR